MTILAEHFNAYVFNFVLNFYNALYSAGLSMHEKSRTDICQTLFGSPQIATYYAFQRRSASNQTVVYKSLRWMDFEHANLTNTSALAERYLTENPSQQVRLVFERTFKMK